MQNRRDRRQFLANASAAAAAGLAAGFLGTQRSSAAEPPPEVRTIRLQKTPTICFAPIYVLDPFLRAEGFDGVQYVTAPGGFPVAQNVARREIDIGVSFAGTVVHHVDAGYPIAAIGGLHVGCYELFAREPIRAISDLKGRRLGIQSLASSSHLYLSIMATHIGLNAQRDIEWVTSPEGDAMERFVAGETDAFLGFPPEPQELRARGMNRVVLNTTTDKPWSQYFCCMMYANRDWVEEHPVATKRFLRAVYMAAEFCTSEPAKAAQSLVDGQFAKRLDYALQTVEELTYNRWHEYDSEDTMRFYALKLHDAGMLQSHPKALLTKGTNWRFLDELRAELKA